MELYGTLRLGKSSGTLWNFLTCVMEPNNYIYRTGRPTASYMNVIV